LDSVAAVQQVPAVHPEFPRQVLARRALRNAAQDQDDDPTGGAGLREEGAGEQLEDRATGPAAVDGALPVLAPLVRCLVGGQGMAVRTGQPARMQDLQQEVIATLFIQQRSEVEKHHRDTSGSRLTWLGRRRTGETPGNYRAFHPSAPLSQIYFMNFYLFYSSLSEACSCE
jgi:hypothetical protein